MKWNLLITLFVLSLASSIICEAEDCQNDTEELNLKFEIQNDQNPNNPDTTSDERFVAVRVDHAGVDELDPELPQIQDIVSPFLPSDHRYCYGVKATREIVNGVKYEIIFVMNNNHDDEIYCEMDVLEKPWLIKDSKKFRKMTYNNCSLTNVEDEDDRLRFQYDVNPTFVNKKIQLNEDDINDMEDQIITSKPRKVTSTTTTMGTTTFDDEDDDATLAPLNPSSKNLLDDFFNMNSYFPPPPSETTTSTTSPLPQINFDALDEMFGMKTIENSHAEQKVLDNESSTNGDDNLQQKRVETVNAAPSKNETALKDLETEIKKVFSELFQSDPDFQANIIALINRKDDSTAHKNYNYVIRILSRKLKDKIETFSQRRNEENVERESDSQVTTEAIGGDIRKKRSHHPMKIWDLAEDALETLDHFDIDDSKRVLLNIISFKEVDGSSLIKIEATIANSHCQENSHEIGNCDEKIDQNSVKVCLLEIKGTEGELTTSQCAPARQRRQIPGGVSPLDVNHDDVKLYLDEALAEINAGEDPDYSVKKVVEASTQVVAGSLVKIKVIMLVGGNEVNCNFEVWEQSWIPNGRQVKVNCDNSKRFKFNQQPVNMRGKSRKRRDTLVGQPIEVDSNDETVFNLLTTHLKRLNTGSDATMELISVEKITRQVVSGLSYKVKGTFRAGSNDPKQCTIDIWTRPWIDGDDGTQIKAECEDGVRLKTKRTKRSLRPMPGRHDKFHSKETSELKAREIKSEVLFENFSKKYHRRYANDIEHKMRHRIFKKNLHKIDMLNKHEQGTAKYGITPFADLTEKEYLHKTGLIMREHSENEVRNPIAEIPDIEIEDLPEEFDWTTKGAVTSVKNQGNCGSCWSFSVTGNVEGLHAIKTGKLEAYSEQELLDCDTTDNACNGGYMDDAFKAIEKIGGLELEEEYPYKAKKQKKCLFNSTMSHVKVKGVVDMPKGDEVAIQKYLVANGPISIGINAAAMQFYRGGVSHPWKILCRKSDLDHGVLLVGYGIKSYPMFNKTLPYWKIKNSWGPKWGEQGFYRIYRGDNSCGVAEMASSAVLE